MIQIPLSDKKEIFSALFALYLQTYSKGTISLETSLLLPNLDRLPSGQAKRILRDASAGKEKKPKKPSYIIKDCTLINVGIKGN